MFVRVSGVCKKDAHSTELRRSCLLQDEEKQELAQQSLGWNLRNKQLAAMFPDHLRAADGGANGAAGTSQSTSAAAGADAHGLRDPAGNAAEYSRLALIKGPIQPVCHLSKPLKASIGCDGAVTPHVFAHCHCRAEPGRPGDKSGDCTAAQRKGRSAVQGYSERSGGRRPGGRQAAPGKVLQVSIPSAHLPFSGGASFSLK